MKVFDLCCDQEHPFEGWFASGEDFDRQLAVGMIECPVCASTEVRKLLSAPRLNLEESQEAAESSGKEPVAMPNDQSMRSMMLQIARHIAVEQRRRRRALPGRSAPHSLRRSAEAFDSRDGVEGRSGRFEGRRHRSNARAVRQSAEESIAVTLTALKDARALVAACCLPWRSKSARPGVQPARRRTRTPESTRRHSR